MGISVSARPGTSSSSALAAYEALAPFYDAFTADYAHDAWLAELAALVEDLGAGSRCVLDVACGTGKSFLPLLARGYDVTACDLSPAMVERARRKLGNGRRRVFVADMRALPAVGSFDLVTCLDDAVNYLLTESDLTAAFCSFARALRTGGLAVFDVNSLSTYRTAFSSDFAFDSEGTLFWWRGEGVADAEPGGIFVATIEILADGGRGACQPTSSRHVQRHHPRPSIEAALAEAGLRCIAVRGQLPGGRLTSEADESTQPKVVYVARKAAQ
jgi:SAM-dependent methyltransferase